LFLGISDTSSTIWFLCVTMPGRGDDPGGGGDDPGGGGDGGAAAG